MIHQALINRHGDLILPGDLIPSTIITSKIIITIISKVELLFSHKKGTINNLSNLSNTMCYIVSPKYLYQFFHKLSGTIHCMHHTPPYIHPLVTCIYSRLLLLHILKSSCGTFFVWLGSDALLYPQNSCKDDDASPRENSLNFLDVDH